VLTTFFVHLQGRDYEGAAAYFDPDEVARLWSAFHRLSELPGGAEGLAKGLGISDSAFRTLSPTSLYGHLIERGIQASPEVSEATQSATFRIIGRVDEDTATVHLILRGAGTVSGMKFSTAELRSLRHTRVGWRLSFPDQMQGVMMGLEKALQGMQQQGSSDQ
jgi:hypothetical protein